MNFRALTIASLTLLAFVQAAIIDHDQVVPFPQSKPTSLTNKAALKFKPQLWINNGCHWASDSDQDELPGCKFNVFGTSVDQFAVNLDACMRLEFLQPAVAYLSEQRAAWLSGTGCYDCPSSGGLREARALATASGVEQAWRGMIRQLGCRRYGNERHDDSAPRAAPA